jgi:uncharacterized protein YjdB
MILSSGVFSENVLAATVGQQLVSPEQGWIRFNDDAKEIYYNKDFAYYKGLSGNNLYFHDDGHGAEVVGAKAVIDFKGTGIRIIDRMCDNRTKKAVVKLDGEEIFITAYSNESISYAIMYEKLGLNENDLHRLELIYSSDSTGALGIDAIDVQSGFLVAPYTVQSIKLDKTSLNLNVLQSETVTAYVYPTDATNKTVKWASSDTKIAEVTQNGIVTGNKVGTATITATTPDGSITATCIVTVSEPNHSNAILTIYLSNQTQRQYDLSSNELSAFLNWYDTRATGTGSVRYGFNKPVASSAFTKRTEYVVYDNIVAFDIDEYTSSGK